MSNNQQYSAVESRRPNRIAKKISNRIESQSLAAESNL